MLRKRFEIITSILFIAIIVFAALNAVRFFTRLDITENKIYTISDVSKNLFKDISEKVTITYYRSNKLKKLSSVPGQIEDMLHEYAAFSRGNIVIRFVDPGETGEEQLAETLGVIPQQVEVVEKNERSVALIYSGIVIEYIAEYETIPLIVRTETLEYDLTTKIRSLIKDRKVKVGFLIGDLSKSLERDFSVLMENIRSVYEFQAINPGEPVPPDITTLVILGNKDITEEHLKEVDNYIMRGGNVCFLVESVYVDINANLSASRMDDNPTLEMLRTYGITLKPGLVCDEFNKDFRIPTRFLGNIAWQVIGPYPYWVAVIQDNVSKENPITARFAGLDLLWCNPIAVEEKNGITYDAFLKSSEESWLVEDEFNTNPYQAQMLSMYRQDDEGSYTLGIVLWGELQSAFSKQKRENSRLMVIGDVDFVTNIIQYSDSTYNFAFLENAVEWLSNEDDLLKIKTRATRDTRLNKIKEPEVRSRVYLFAIIINVVIIPLLFVLFGVRRFFVRRRKMRSEEE